MTYTPIVPAELAFAGDGTPHAPPHDDVGHAADGLAQARHTFLAGNDLPKRWRQRERFVICATTFGPGLNFLATWQAWRDDPDRPRRLHFVSIEKHPFRHEDLARLHDTWPELRELAEHLRRAWPPALSGLHRLHFEGGAITLTLALGKAPDLLPRLALHADAFFLDSSSPVVAAEVGRLAAPGATLATWSATSAMRSCLEASDWSLEQRTDCADKRDMLVGYRPGVAGDGAPPRRIAVIGAGIAGTAIAHRLHARGAAVEVFERETEPGRGASGNLAGVFRPLPSLDDAPLARLLRACFLYGKRHIENLAGVRYDFSGVLHLARDARHEDTQRRVVAEHALPPDFLRFVERAEAAKLAGWPVEIGGWWFSGGGWLNPPSLCRAQAAGIPLRTGCAVAALERTQDGWHLIDADGATLTVADAVVLANANDAKRLSPDLPLRLGRGQVTHLAAGSVPPFGIVATRLGYVTPAIDGFHCAGATLTPDDTTPELRRDDHIENLTRLDMILPAFGKGLDPALLPGRVGFRPMSPDRMPLVGPWRPEEFPGLWVLNGFGARGLVWAALCAELLASQLHGDPLPLETDLVAALAPSRIHERARRRGQM